MAGDSSNSPNSNSGSKSKRKHTKKQHQQRREGTEQQQQPSASASEDQLSVLVQQLREKLKDSEQYSYKTRIDDNAFLVMFLRVKDYDLHRALEAVEKYYRHFQAFPELLTGIRSSAGYQDIYDDHIFVLLKARCKRGTSVSWISMGNWDPDKHPILKGCQSNVFQLQELIQDENAQLAGYSMVVDFKGLSFAHMKQLRPYDLKFMIRTYQDGIPMRMTAIHLVNYPVMVWGLYYIAQPFLKEKLRRRIHFHKNLEALHEYIDKGTLPEALGGPLELEEAVDRKIEKKLIQNDQKYEDYYC